MTPISLAIVDDHQLFRKGIRALLEDMENVEVRIEASSGQQAG